MTSALSRPVAGVAELVDAPDLGSGDENRGGSTPFARTRPCLFVSTPSLRLALALFGRGDLNKGELRCK